MRSRRVHGMPGMVGKRVQIASILVKASWPSQADRPLAAAARYNGNFHTGAGTALWRLGASRLSE